MNQDKVTKFYQFTLFGKFEMSSEEHKIKVASRRAYRDLCRTLLFKEGIKENDEKKLEAYNAVVKDVILKQIHNFEGISNENDFRSWHKAFCEGIIANFEKNCIEFYFGQAQKWVNMTMKYLCILSPEKYNYVYKFLHIPLDGIIIKNAHEKLGLDKPNVPWSRLDEETYYTYQTSLIAKIKAKNKQMVPLDWEFDTWLEGIEFSVYLKDQQE